MHIFNKVVAVAAIWRAEGMQSKPVLDSSSLRTLMLVFVATAWCVSAFVSACNFYHINGGFRTLTTSDKGKSLSNFCLVRKPQQWQIGYPKILEWS